MVKQQMPTQGKADVSPVVENYLTRYGSAVPQPVTESILERFRKRNEEGLKTYGTPLQTHNGRDALLDALDEGLDMVQYITQAMMERIGDNDTVAELGQMRDAVTMTCFLLTSIILDSTSVNNGQ